MLRRISRRGVEEFKQSAPMLSVFWFRSQKVLTSSRSKRHPALREPRISNSSIVLKRPSMQVIVNNNLLRTLDFDVEEYST